MIEKSKRTDFGLTVLYKASFPAGHHAALNIIHMIGYHKVNDRYGIERKQGAPSWLLLLTVGGKGSVTIAQNSFSAAPGTAILIPPNIANSYCTVKGEEWEFYWIHFSGSIASIYSADMIKNLAYSTAVDIGTIREFMHAYLAVDVYAIDREFDISELLSRFLGFLLKQSSCCVYTDNERNIVADIIKDLNSLESAEFSLEDLANRYHYSKEYLIRLFKKAVGMPPYRYYLLLRLDRSRIALQNSDQTVEQIAADCGYKTVGSYSKQFKKYFRLSPSEYRRTHAVVPN